jgi:hypothetical protein
VYIFQNFKNLGFDWESRHLRCWQNLSKLLVFVSLAVAICVKFGKVYHQKVQKIKVKKHGYQANSFFRKGLNIIRRGLKNTSQEFIDLWESCSQTFIRWVELQLAYNQHFKKIIG